MNIIWSDVLLAAPELTTVTDGQRHFILRYVNGTGIDVTSLDGEAGETTHLARVYLAAHMAAMELRGASGPSGSITAQREGQVSANYVSPDGIRGATMLSETPYGRLFAMLIRRNHNSRGPRTI